MINVFTIVELSKTSNAVTSLTAAANTGISVDISSKLSRGFGSLRKNAPLCTRTQNGIRVHAAEYVSYHSNLTTELWLIFDLGSSISTGPGVPPGSIGFGSDVLTALVCF